MQVAPEEEEAEKISQIPNGDEMSFEGAEELPGCKFKSYSLRKVKAQLCHLVDLSNFSEYKRYPESLGKFRFQATAQVVIQWV